jgi:hypothetical protein
MSDGIDICAELRAHVARKYGKQKHAAAAWGVSNAFVSSVLSGRKTPTEQILADAGLVRAVIYRRAAHG